MPFKLICRNPVLLGIKFPDTNKAVVGRRNSRGVSKIESFGEEGEVILMLRHTQSHSLSLNSYLFLCCKL